MKIVSLKALGDFVIAANVISRLNQNKNSIGIIAGSHLKDIAVALGVTENVQFIGRYSYPKIPPTFNFKKSRILESFADIVYLRNQIGQIAGHTQLVFDQPGIRELFIGFGRNSLYLPRDTPNIYLAYEKLFTDIGVSFYQPPKTPKRQIKKVVIIPGARVQFRNIPRSVISRVLKILKNREIDFSVITFAGEDLDVPLYSNMVVLPRDFGSLISSIKSADLVLSADSLPAHLSFYLDIPVFVFTPIPAWTIKWLPLSAYRSKAFADFSDETAFGNWLGAI
jgi:ADP-heptose:LPS heptosyltransferase